MKSSGTLSTKARRIICSEKLSPSAKIILLRKERKRLLDEKEDKSRGRELVYVR